MCNEHVNHMGRVNEWRGMNGKGVQKGWEWLCEEWGKERVCAKSTRCLVWVCTHSENGLGLARGEGIMCKEYWMSVQVKL